MPIAQAHELARKQNLDLAEIAPTSVPPVCRLMDYGKFKYEQAKKEHEARKNQRVSAVRQIRLRPKIGDHDFEAKARTAKKLLAEGDKVRITIIFRGREITHPEFGLALLKRMTEKLSDIASFDKPPVMLGKQINLTLAPVANSKARMKETIKEPVKETVKEAQHAKT